MQAGDCSTHILKEHPRDVPAAGTAHRDQWDLNTRCLGRWAQGVGGAVEEVGKGTGVPQGGEWDGQEGVCRAAVSFLTHN